MIESLCTDRYARWCGEVGWSTNGQRDLPKFCVKVNKYFQSDETQEGEENWKEVFFNMEKASKEMLREFVNSQHFTSTSEIMESMKELFSDVLQQVMEAELEEKLGYEKSERLSKNDENSCRENYRNGLLKGPMDSLPFSHIQHLTYSMMWTADACRDLPLAGSFAGQP